MREKDKYYKYGIYCSAVESYHELAALELTIKRQDLGITKQIKKIVVDMLRDSNFELQLLAKWALGLLKAYGVRRNLGRKSFDGLSLDLHEFTRLERPKINLPKGNAQKETNTFRPNIQKDLNLSGFTHKRAALQDLDGEPTGYVLLEDELQQTTGELSLEEINMKEFGEIASEAVKKNESIDLSVRSTPMGE